LQAQSEAGIANWIVTGYQQSDLANKFIVEGTGEIQPQVDWVLSQYQKITPKSPEPVVGELFLQDKKGNTNVTRTQTQPIEVIKITDTLVRKEGDYKIEKFSLILFDFDKATIEGINKKIVEFMRRRIQPNSEIEIIGYTDRTGTPEYNKQLSKRRADAVKEALNRPDVVAIGVGQERLLYDNNLPEGRFYCRTVEVNVKTRIK
jgi:outer membrane protein OmpA-like peptidoglycan-associated protein